MWTRTNPRKAVELDQHARRLGLLKLLAVVAHPVPRDQVAVNAGQRVRLGGNDDVLERNLPRQQREVDRANIDVEVAALLFQLPLQDLGQNEPQHTVWSNS